MCVLEAGYRQLFRNVHNYIDYEKEAGEDFSLQNKAMVHVFKKTSPSLFYIHSSWRRN